MANLAPPLKFTAWDSSGNPLAGGKLYTYVAGTTTPKATYTDSGLGTPNANPVILNSRGEASVWLSGAYQLVLKDASDVTIYSQDNVTDALTNSTISGTLTISSTAVTWSGNPTHSGNHTFSGNVSVQGNTTLGNAGTDTVTTSGNVVMGAPTSGATLAISGVAATAGATYTSNGMTTVFGFESGGISYHGTTTSHATSWLVGNTSRWTVDTNGKFKVNSATSGYSFSIPTKTPSSASDTGVTGDISWDSSYIYVCTGTNTWKRAAIATW